MAFPQKHPIVGNYRMLAGLRALKNPSAYDGQAFFEIDLS